ncbi:MAG: electron transfer flavoprotein subunit beta/FixA family protein [Gammaproteobacteria bacterium]|nr:electron transfer flavoprotein subunit beta/FixA family protein [Gammaproteobacteria bacterium]
MTGTADIGPLDVLVCLKFVPDPAQLRADASGQPDLIQAPLRISNFDENAIETALQLTAQHGGRAFGLSVIRGRKPPPDVLLRALAMGLNALYLVVDETDMASDPFRLAVAIAAAAKVMREAEAVPLWHLLICGEASADEYNAQIGPRLAVALDLPAITHAIRIELERNLLIARRSVDGRCETVETELPALATVGTEINHARIPTVLQIMGAGRKPVREMTLHKLLEPDLDAMKRYPTLKTMAVFALPSTRKRILIDGGNPKESVNQLLTRLGADGEIRF